MDQRTHAASASIDDVEIGRFEVPLETWWESSGETRWLHRYNPVRVHYIRDAACRRWERDPRRVDCLRGLRVLDIGCGGGVMCEPVAALGAMIIGADPAKRAIEAARLHALRSGTEIDYRWTTAEALADGGEKFDIVLAMEVIEHVADTDVFLSRCAELVNPGGLMILSTINRTVKSFVYAIVAAEYILRLLPPGTHQWERFFTPEEFRTAMRSHGLRVTDVRGVTMNLRSRMMQLSADTRVNFLATAQREGHRDFGPQKALAVPG